MSLKSLSAIPEAFSLDVLSRHIVRRKCYESNLYFTKTLFKAIHGRQFRTATHNVKMADVLDQVFRGEIMRLIISIPPRYGKTEQAVKNFIAQGLAYNAAARFIHLSYSDDLALDNSDAIREMVKHPAYQTLFPHVKVRQTSDSKKKWYTTEGGGVYAVSTGGQVTGFGAGEVDLAEVEDIETEIDDFINSIADVVAHKDPVHAGGKGWINPGKTFKGAIVIDDPIKPEDAESDIVRVKVNKRFDNTIRSRVNSRTTPIIIIMQRLHPEDLAGYVQEQEPGEWTVLSLPAMYVNEGGELVTLDPVRHTVAEIQKMIARDPITNERQYQQNPSPREGLLYHEFNTYANIPPPFTKVRVHVDIADEGEDYLCAIAYRKSKLGAYVTGVIFTQQKAEITEVRVADMCNTQLAEQLKGESNAGGKGFIRAVESLCRGLRNFVTKFRWFPQRKNKKARILSNASKVNNYFYFPEDWAKRWPEFYKHITGFNSNIEMNKHDDGPDNMTSIFEHEEIRAKQGIRRAN